MENQKFSPVFFLLGVLFVTCLLISNIIAGKLIDVAGFTLTAGVILFPVTYILGNVITEVYGFVKSRLIIWGGFACNLLMITVFMIALKLPSPHFWDHQNAYEVVLGMTPKIVLASLIAYLLGEFANSVVLSKLKVLTNGRWLWLRTISSSIVGEGLDTTLFISITFFAEVPSGVLIQMIILQYIWKVSYQAIFTPVTYLVANYVKRYEGIDTFDIDIKYNPFRVDI